MDTGRATRVTINGIDISAHLDRVETSPVPCRACRSERALFGAVNQDGDYMTVCADCGACTVHPPQDEESVCP